MKNFLFIQRKPEDFVVITRYADPGRSPLDGDQLRTRGKLETVGQRRESGGDLGIRLVTGKPRLLSHCILELIEVEISFGKTHREVSCHGENQQRKQTSEPAHPATVYHCDCAPSITVFTTRSIACFLPTGSPRSGYWPSASKPFRCQRVFPVT
jgi:hypothetical protein